MCVPPFLPFLRKFSLGGAMKKRNLLSVVLLALCAVLVFTGCNANKAEESQGELLLVAKEKTTEFQVVNYLEEDQKVREFLADLLIKTGAKYPIVEASAVGEHTIYIGTAAQFSDQGIATGAMSYSNYSIFVENGNIYVCMGLESMAEDVLTLLKENIIKQEDGSFCIDATYNVSKDLSEISEAIPMFKTEAGKFRDLHDCGNGNYQASYYELDALKAPQEVADYESALLAEGYTRWQENEIEGSRFATYYKGDTLIHINYFAPMNEFRIVYGPKTYLPENKPVTEYEELIVPTVSIIEGTENVLCMVIQLADGSFWVIDGGWDDVSLQSKTLNAGAKNERLVEYKRDSKQDMKVLFEFMKERTPGGGKPQVTWMITHADPDHILLPARFFKDYADKFDLNTIVYNFPNLYNIGLGESGGSTNDPMIMTSYAESFLYQANKNFPDVNHYVYHAGDKLYLPGGELEFLFAAGEDYWPNAMPWMNHTSGVWRFTLEGKTIMITGDAEKGICNQMVGVFGDYLKSDILQVNHHGANGATLSFYRKIQPIMCFWPCQQYHLDYDNRQTGVNSNYLFNRYLRQKDDIIGHYSNTETHTIRLPSLEEE